MARSFTNLLSRVRQVLEITVTEGEGRDESNAVRPVRYYVDPDTFEVLARHDLEYPGEDGGE